MTLPAHTVSIGIARSLAMVAAYLGAPANFNHWASGLGNSLRQDAQGVWRGNGPAGPITIRFSPANALGVADHWVGVAPGVEVYVPLRVIANGEGSEVLLTLFQLPGMDSEQFQGDIDWVRRDLAALKALLEA